MDTKLITFAEAPPVTVSAPYSREAEDAIIGAVIINPAEIDELVIEPQDFYIRRNQVIWAALISCVADTILRATAISRISRL